MGRHPAHDTPCHASPMQNGEVECEDLRPTCPPTPCPLEQRMLPRWACCTFCARPGSDISSGSGRAPVDVHEGTSWRSEVCGCGLLTLPSLQTAGMSLAGLGSMASAGTSPTKARRHAWVPAAVTGRPASSPPPAGPCQHAGLASSRTAAHWHAASSVCQMVEVSTEMRLGAVFIGCCAWRSAPIGCMFSLIHQLPAPRCMWGCKCP